MTSNPTPQPTPERAQPMTAMKIWECKIGEVDRRKLPSGSDWPMRQAIQEAYTKLTGEDALFIFSGWAGELNEGERAVVENRLPNCPKCNRPHYNMEDSEHCRNLASPLSESGATEPDIPMDDDERKRYWRNLPRAESGATEGNTEAADLAREIVTRIVTNAITSIYVRNLDQGDELPTEEESVADGLAIALGDEIGCLSEDDDDFRERIDVLWLEDRLAASLKPEPTGAQGRADKAPSRDGFSALEVDEICCEWGPPEYVATDDGEAWYWRFPGHDLPVADNLSELFYAALQLKPLTPSEPVSPVGQPDVERMVQRFLGWRLPEDFHPDDGISFEPLGNKGHATAEYKRQPSGTNLFNYEQATKMVRYMTRDEDERETPEQAFERGYKAGWLHSAEGTSQLPLNAEPVSPQPKEDGFEAWWAAQTEECEQGPSPEEYTIAFAAWKAGRASR